MAFPFQKQQSVDQGELEDLRETRVHCPLAAGLDRSQVTKQGQGVAQAPEHRRGGQGLAGHSAEEEEDTAARGSHWDRSQWDGSEHGWLGLNRQLHPTESPTLRTQRPHFLVFARFVPLA